MNPWLLILLILAGLSAVCYLVFRVVRARFFEEVRHFTPDMTLPPRKRDRVVRYIRRRGR